MAGPIAKTWHLLPHDPQIVSRLASQLGCSSVVAQLLINRGLTEVEPARRFLEAPLAGLHAPELMPGIKEAVDHILSAIRDRRRICVYGDYDVDGLTGSAILFQCLRILHADVDLYVPNRLEEGYGLNREAIGEISRKGVSLIITVDCGIASIVEAEEARRLGVELIITDHHAFKDTLPNATVLVHPRLPGTTYPFGGLSGSAVAFKLAWALAQRECGGARVTPRFREFLLDAVALACLGVVADVVPLHDENRILVRHGLLRLQQQPMAGLRALCSSAQMDPSLAVRATDVGYRIAPRINAAGRLGSALQVVELLITANQERATELARSLEEENARRQEVERIMMAQARRLIDEQKLLDHSALVVAHDSWHPGVIGIVAGRMAELFARPALMIALPGKSKSSRQAGDASSFTDLAVGSGRSIPGFALNVALQECSDLLIGHGGHPMAAGFRLLPDRIDPFRERFCDYAARFFPRGLPSPRLLIDAEVPLAVLTPGLLAELDRLEPYGAENRRPIFMTGPVQVVGDPRRVGQNERHLSFRVQQQEHILKAIAFGMGERIDQLMAAGGSCFLAFQPKMNTWMNRRTIDLEVVDFQAGIEAAIVV